MGEGGQDDLRATEDVRLQGSATDWTRQVGSGDKGSRAPHLSSWGCQVRLSRAPSRARHGGACL